MDNLLQTIIAFITADSWNKSQQIVLEHPELLHPEVDEAIRKLCAALSNEQTKELAERHRVLLARCREIGVREAFAEKMRSLQAPESDSVQIPPGFEADSAEGERLAHQAQREPQAFGRLIEVYERMLERLPSGEHSTFRAALLHNLGNAYVNLMTLHREANLMRAIECYHQALHVYTPKNAPIDYAMTQNSMGFAYASLPTGDRAANLTRAIECYHEALRFRTPQTMPLKYASTLMNLALAYQNLPTGERRANLAQATRYHHQALRFFTLENTPFEYATTQYNLGRVYLRLFLLVGDEEANLVQAVQCFEQALRVFTPSSMPHQYAVTQNNLGNAYADLTKGDRGTNLARAIECYHEALAIHTPDVAPFDYATTQHNLGTTYYSLPTGDQEANLAQAIACYQEALRFQTLEAAPHEYATTQNNLAATYFKLSTIGSLWEQEANLAQAITCYQEALRVYTLSSAPLEYAMTQNNLGAAYAELQTGDRRANLARVIACYQEALRVYTPSATPIDYAMTQNNLGSAYTKLPTWDLLEREANLVRAIKCYQEALRIYTPQNAPYEYADTQTNLGSTYADLPTDDQGANLTLALECYSKAMRVYTPETTPFRYATCQNNLASTYRKLPTGDRVKNLKAAFKCYQEALRIYTPQSAPFEYARTQHQLGHTYFDLATADGQRDFGLTIACFKEALRFWTKETAPHDCRLANGNLANIYFAQKEWPAALSAYRAAQEAGERLYRVGLSAESKAIEVAQNVALYHHAAFAAACLGDTTEALLILERGKTRLLAEALRLRVPRPKGISDEVWTAFLEAGAAVRAAQSEGSGITGQEHDPSLYDVRVQAARAANAALDAAVARIREHAPDFLSEIDRSAIQALLPDEATALVAFCITDQGSYGFIADAKVQMVHVPSFTQTQLSRLLIERDAKGHPIGGWIGAYQSQDESRWHSTIEQVLTQVGEKLLAPILAALSPNIKKLILLPSGGLFLLPLHAAPLSDNERVCDRYQVSYAPSAEVLSDLRRKTTNTSQNDLVAVINPEEDPELPFTPAEGAAIRSLFSQHQVLMRRAGTKEAVMNGVRGRAYLHFSCHGTYNWDDPPKSGLALADGQLTLAELQGGEVDMSAARLVTLSACETGMTDIIKGSPEEYVGLPAGFMLAGVPCVVSSLWSVPDLSTALLMERFYSNHLKSGMDFVSALHEAQQWVRELAIGEVAKYAEKCFRQAKRKDQAQLFTHMQHYQYRAQQDPNERPFAHPYYWAAFTVNGM